jgi:hypothetical protein
VSDVTISETASAAPSFLHRFLKGWSVTPAIGAAITGDFNVYEPIFMMTALDCNPRFYRIRKTLK